MSETKTVWHKYPDEKPPKDDWYLITYLDKSGEKWVITEEYDKKKGRFLREPFDLNVLAWAYAPEPFEEEKVDMHPDAITARKYIEGDPETVKALHIFDEGKE